MKPLFCNDYRMGVLKGQNVVDVTSTLQHIGTMPLEYLAVEIEGLERLILHVKSYGPRKDAHWRPPGTRSA